MSTRPHMQKDRLHTSHVTDPVVRARIRWIMETLTYLQEKREALHEKKNVKSVRKRGRMPCKINQ